MLQVKQLTFTLLYYTLKGNAHKVWHNEVKSQFSGSYQYVLKTQTFFF